MVDAGMPQVNGLSAFFPPISADLWREALQEVRTIRPRGRVVNAVGTSLRVRGLQVGIGQQCVLIDRVTDLRLRAEVIGFVDGDALLTPLGPLMGLSAETEVYLEDAHPRVQVGDAIMGRVLDAFGEPIDGRGPLSSGMTSWPVFAEPPSPMTRPIIDAVLPTGVHAIDAFMTLGRGQRIGVFAAAGVGKSTLMGMIAQRTTAQAIVVALIGERGREVAEFIVDSIGPQALQRSVLVVATSDRPAAERVRAAHCATAIAEYLREQGLDVMLMMDSATRYARALREMGLAAGEPAVRRGYPPSVFAELPRLFERAGRNGSGSISAIYTVLLEDEDASDPIGEEVRSLLDGHIVLSRKLADQAFFPAVDVSASLSRLSSRLVHPAHLAAANTVRRWLAKHAEIEFLVQVGEYKPGEDKVADEAIARMPAIRAFLQQGPEVALTFDQMLAALLALVA